MTKTYTQYEIVDRCDGFYSVYARETPRDLADEVSPRFAFRKSAEEWLSKRLARVSA